jgi:multidrug efflux system outer membrane protein
MRTLLLILPIFALASCSVGPDYAAPQEKLEVSFKDAGFNSPPPVGDWWASFRDPQLTALMQRAEDANPQARAALARYDQARAALGLTEADRFPAVTGAAFTQRNRSSGSTSQPQGGMTENDFRAALNVSWEIDLWGRVRRSVTAARAQSSAASYDYQAAITSLRGEIARTYFSLRYADAEIKLLDETAAFRQEASRLMSLRSDAGDVSPIDAQRAISEHESVRTELARLRVRRGQLENALGTLTGEGASAFTFAQGKISAVTPPAPSAVPSELLRRRPDLAAAERRLAFASEAIGITVANYLPTLNLVGIGGAQAVKSSDLYNSNSRLWTLGPELSVPIFQGGRYFSDRAQAEAAYREALEKYREVLLRAVQEMEDSLIASRELTSANASSERGANAARLAAKLTRSRYEGGIASYFELVDAERTALAEERAVLSVRLDRALAATRLVQALGGGWVRQ